MSTIRATPDTGGTRLTFPYDPDVIALVKTVPGHRRRYSATTKAWWIASTEITSLIGVLESAGHRVVGWTATSTPPPPPRSTGQNWADTLLTAVGPTRTEAVFRALTKVLHPDVATGDTVLTQQLNSARDRMAVRR